MPAVLAVLPVLRPCLVERTEVDRRDLSYWENCWVRIERLCLVEAPKKAGHNSNLPD